VQETLHGIFLAPDWGISNIKQFAHLLESNLTGKLRGKFADLPESAISELAKRSELQGAMGRRYWARQAAYSFLGVEFMNYLFSSMNGDAHFTWDNAPGHTLDFVLPYKDDEGREQYVSVGKQTREVFRWATDLPRNLGSKLAPTWRALGEQLTNHDVGSGFPAPWAEERYTGVRPTFFESIPKRTLNLAEYFVPFSFQGHQFGFTLPKSVGMTNDKFIQLYTRAAEDNDRGQMQRIIISAKANNLNVVKLVGAVNRNLSYKKKQERLED
jgi:hypothetical protein